MDSSSSFMALVSSFGHVFTASTSANVGVLVRGAVLSQGARTVTGCLLAAWPWVERHHSCYGNVLRRAKFSMRSLAQALFRRILPLLPEGSVIELLVDETLVRRYGPRVVGVGMHRDAVRSSKSRVTTTPGHKWVTVAVVLPLPYTGRVFALPLVSAMYSTKKRAKRNRAKRPYRKHRTVTQLTQLLVRMIVRWAPDRRFRVIGDGAYGTHDLAEAFHSGSKRVRLRKVTLVSRFRKDARLFAAPAYGGRGRRPVKGPRLPSPGEAASDPDARWRSGRIVWYGRGMKTIDICSGVALWYKCGSMAKKVRWVLVRDPEGKRDDEVFFTTDLGLKPWEIVEAYVRRWNLETTFQELRGELGLETQRNWCDASVRRAVPLLTGVYSLIVVWFASSVHDPMSRVFRTPWHDKRHVTFSDMLRSARCDLVSEFVNEHSGSARGGSFSPGVLWDVLTSNAVSESRSA